jgi:putative Holliday junction resolvase
VGIVERAGDRGMDELLALIRAEEPERVVVGLPLTLRGERGEQARVTEAFVELLRSRVDVPVETWDERFTTTLAERGGGADAEAAAHLLSGYLEWAGARR